MSKPQYGILRFHKYKGPEIGQIEAHNERTKEKYASNPDIDPARKHLNYNLLTPPPKYRAEAERQIREAGCRTRKDSVRLVETLITASSEFFQGKSQQEIRAYFERALEFMKSKQKPDKPSVQRLLELEKKVQEQEELQRTISSMQQTLTAIPPEIIAEYNDPKTERKETIAIE